jgi:hypothetical protein
MSIGAPELLILLLLGGGFAGLVVGIVSAVDAANQPDWAWEQAGENKTMWIVVPLVGLVACGVVGLIAGIVYFVSVRPQVRRVQGGV